MTKLEAYRAGLYRFPVPSVTTAHWTEQDWINFVDIAGIWTVDVV